eukprot:TRINITY_DN6391_c0_g1_i12.p1 TRINITY_DN6391_c0_g1~~TRINITY_DN6391_c0_g1_i12.p1  ORF type:complete len:183 (-),score=60.84 TRINITY_DN6391_c0_g1_i12:133-681(-)
MKKLVQKWDEEKLADYREDATNQMFELKKRHKNEIPTKDQIEQRSKSTLKHCSAQISELRRKQESLIQFGKYREAKKLSRMINKVRAQDTERNKNAVLEKLNLKVLDIQRKHSKEIAAMEMKTKRDWIVLLRQRKKDFDVIKKWYKNSKHDITQKYSQSWQKLEFYSPIVRMNKKNNISNFT